MLDKLRKPTRKCVGRPIRTTFLATSGTGLATAEATHTRQADGGGADALVERIGSQYARPAPSPRRAQRRAWTPRSTSTCRHLCPRVATPNRLSRARRRSEPAGQLSLGYRRVSASANVAFGGPLRERHPRQPTVFRRPEPRGLRERHSGGWGGFTDGSPRRVNVGGASVFRQPRERVRNEMGSLVVAVSVSKASSSSATP